MKVYGGNGGVYPYTRTLLTKLKLSAIFTYWPIYFRGKSNQNTLNNEFIVLKCQFVGSEKNKILTPACNRTRTIRSFCRYEIKRVTYTQVEGHAKMANQKRQLH